MHLRGWPKEQKKIANELKAYWGRKRDIHVSNGLLFANNLMVVPNTLRIEMLKQINTYMQTILWIPEMQERTKQLMYWPGKNVDIRNFVANCKECEK